MKPRHSMSSLKHRELLSTLLGVLLASSVLYIQTTLYLSKKRDIQTYYLRSKKISHALHTPTSLSLTALRSKLHDLHYDIRPAISSDTITIYLKDPNRELSILLSLYLLMDPSQYYLHIDSTHTQLIIGRISEEKTLP